MSKCTLEAKVFGRAGHEQGESFLDSFLYDFSEPGDLRIIEVFNADKTGTHEYAIMRITRNTLEDCYDEAHGQISDGVFENYKTGKIEWRVIENA